MEFRQAQALHHCGRTEEAASAYERIIQADPGHVDALIRLGVLRLGRGRAAEAEALLRRALSVSPESPEALGNLAAALQALGHYEEAAAEYERALACKPDMTDARFGLAACLQAGGRHEAAITCYEALLDRDPAHPEANYGLASLLAQIGRADEAAARYRAALAADPDFAEASYELGKLLARGNTPIEAIACFLHALDVDPDYIEARVALATALTRFDRDEEAMAAFRAVLAADPGHADAQNGIGILLDRKQRHAEAADHFRAVLARNPQQVDAMAGLANTMKNTGQHDQALALGRQVVALRPQFAPAASLLGSILAEIGLMDEAQAELRRAVTLAPGRPESLYHLALLAKVRPDDGTLQALEAALPRIATLPPREQSLLRFALAKAYDDVGERDRGFDHLLLGNATKRAQSAYREAGTLGAMDRIRSVFSAEFLAARRDLGDPSAAPVFIVGMPRSGTTLVEQTLASHKSVFGAGERTELSHAIARMNAERFGSTSFPEAAWTLADAQLRQMGTHYVAALRALAPDAARITDKMPGNFLFVGLIHLILPNARIIHTVRDPVDTCLSCFSMLFTGEQAFTYDLAELGRYYRAYERLMSHWRAVLPAGVLLEVEYESTVSDFEAQARRIVAHCGLEWDPACLEFYKTARPVHTASMTQVRQPIYYSSVGRWRPKPALLQPLIDALGTTSVGAAA
jgi:tetratricopeptide (TPR) repeat protein